MTREERWNYLTARTQAVVLAADVDSLDELRRLATLAAEVAPAVAAIKVGALLAMRHGLAATVRVVESACDLPIIYDHQKAGTDIPQMGRPFAKACREAGVQAVIFFPMSGPRTLEAFVGGAREEMIVPIVGVAMSHAAYLESEGGYVADAAPDAICKSALALGVCDFVLPGTKLDIITRFARGALGEIEARIFIPGIGSQGGIISSVVAAARPHSAFPIIGSSVYAAPDPRVALDSFIAQIGNGRQVD